MKYILTAWLIFAELLSDVSKGKQFISLTQVQFNVSKIWIYNVQHLCWARDGIVESILV